MLESAVIESVGDASVPVSQRGTGFQSALVLGILRYVAQKESQAGANLMFAVEEPEAFLHPQTQRAMAKIIRDISNDAQVLVTSHSSVLVDSFDIAKIARLPLQAGGSDFVWQKPALEPTDAGRLSRYCSAANSELVFANAVIFVEGEGDHAVLERILNRVCRAASGHYALGVTVIEAGGITKIQHLVALADLFGIRSYVIADADGIRKAGSGKREVEDILRKRKEPPSREVLDAFRQLADKENGTLNQALTSQKKINKVLDPYDVFVMSSDLEGLFLDAMGLEGVVAALGPEGDGAMDATFAKDLLESEDGFEKCAKWMGSRGWNSTRKPSAKLEPHLAPILLDACYANSEKPGPVLKPLVDWLDAIVKRAHLSPL